MNEPLIRFFDDPRLFTISGFTALAVLLTIAVWHDVRAYRIPNWVLLSGTVGALLLHSVLPYSLGFASFLSGGMGFLSALGGAGAGLTILLPFYILGAAGAGDVKLMGMVGAFVGPGEVIGVALMTFVAGAVIAVGLALRAGVLKLMALNVRFIVESALTRRVAAGGPSFDSRTDTALKLPYALAIALGTGVWLALKYYA